LSTPLAVWRERICVINWESSSGDRTVPNFVVALTLSIAVTTVVSKNTLNLTSVIGHQAAHGDPLFVPVITPDFDGHDVALRHLVVQFQKFGNQRTNLGL
jgi:hypothetical protein